MQGNWLEDQLSVFHVSQTAVEVLTFTIVSLLVLATAAAITFIIRRTLLKYLTDWIRSNNHQWDDPLANNRLLNKISWFVPIAIFSLSIDTFLTPGTPLSILAKRLVTTGFVIITVISITALLTSINDIYTILKKDKGTALRGYIDAGKIIVYVLGTIFIISIFTGKSPWGILSVLGGLTAVTMLVFKDSILGFVASIQLNSTDMVHIGDWIEMPQYAADGDVIDMSIHTIRVQNWDKTITTIPTYALVANSFKNWRGMSESGGRRIKRSLAIDIQSIRFCDDRMLERYSRIDLIKDYVADKQQEIREYNRQHSFDKNLAVNGRNQTNVGIFRAYIIAYLKNNAKINREMTFLIRQLAPMDRGLPIEIYVFSKDQVWANYEAIQADIFDHLLAAAPEFDLSIFQSPSSYDFRCLAGAVTGSAS
jgi:miniconductance mechanosensitive channel